MLRMYIPSVSSAPHCVVIRGTLAGAVAAPFSLNAVVTFSEAAFMAIKLIGTSSFILHSRAITGTGPLGFTSTEYVSRVLCLKTKSLILVSNSFTLLWYRMDHVPSKDENMLDSASLNVNFFSFSARPSFSSSSLMSIVKEALKSKPTIFCAPSWKMRTFLF